MAERDETAKDCIVKIEKCSLLKLGNFVHAYMVNLQEELEKSRNMIAIDKIKADYCIFIEY